MALLWRLFLVLVAATLVWYLSQKREEPRLERKSEISLLPVGTLEDTRRDDDDDGGLFLEEVRYMEATNETNSTNITIVEESTGNSTTTTSLIVATDIPTFSPTSSPYLTETQSGALVTRDCYFTDYPYALDISWSCGDERFNDPLRLHTIKRHSFSHRKIFRDQLVTYRSDSEELWFEEYNIPRCVRVASNDDLRLSTGACAQFQFLKTENANSYIVQEVSTGRCVGLGNSVTCSDNRYTGGNECGGVDHRFLPLTMMDDCNAALSFVFETQANDCTNGERERPPWKECF